MIVRDQLIDNARAELDFARAEALSCVDCPRSTDADRALVVQALIDAYDAYQAVLLDDETPDCGVSASIRELFVSLNVGIAPNTPKTMAAVTAAYESRGWIVTPYTGLFVGIYQLTVTEPDPSKTLLTHIVIDAGLKAIQSVQECK